MIIYCPNANSFDFFIIDEGKRIHAIQVSVQTPLKKCNTSSFFKTDVQFKYLLMPFEVNFETVKEGTTLYNACKMDGLRIISGASLLNEEELKAFQPQTLVAKSTVCLLTSQTLVVANFRDLKKFVKYMTERKFSCLVTLMYQLEFD